MPRLSINPKVQSINVQVQVKPFGLVGGNTIEISAVDGSFSMRLDKRLLQLGFFNLPEDVGLISMTFMKIEVAQVPLPGEADAQLIDAIKQ